MKLNSLNEIERNILCGQYKFVLGLYFVIFLKNKNFDVISFF